MPTPERPRRPDEVDQHSGTVANEPIPADDLYRGTMASPVPPQSYSGTHIGLDPTVLLPALAESEAGKMVGAYRLLRKIGEGGMGDVWVAEQPDPRREVALKRVKSIAASPYVMQKFEAERQILALMDHPNIARVIDGGTSDRGEPFYVMELVSGLALNEYCDRHRLTIRNRLLLFRDICAGVQHAHQKGIVHRDLKPANILVAKYDGKAVPKIIDFGIARVRAGTCANIEETMSGGVMGTLEYMSPEQASGQQDIDTRADVWSLGVILYELLTGSTPFRHKLRQTALVEALRIICQDEPTRPGTHVSTSHAPAELAASRQVDIRQLARVIQGDPEWIVMKALEKDRSRRYDSPSAMSEDIRRHLEDEPVLAGPPTRSYKLKKFLKKHRAGVAFAACVFLLLIAGMATSTWQMVRAGRAEARARVALDHESEAREATEVALTRAEEDRRQAVTAREQGEIARQQSEVARLQAETARLQAETARAEAVAATQAAQTARDAAKATSDFVIGIFRKPDPGVSGREIRVGDLLDLATTDLTNNKTLTSTARAQLIDAIAGTWQGLGEPKKVLPLREEVVTLRMRMYGPGHPVTASSRGRLGWAYHQTGDNIKALPLLEETLAETECLFGPDDTRTLNEELQLGFVLLFADQIPRGIALMERCLGQRRASLGDDHADTLTAINNLAIGYNRNREYDKAIALLEECVASSRRSRGDNHTSTLLNINNLANFHRDRKDFARAIPLYEECLERRTKVLGPNHKGVLTTASALAYAYRDDKQHVKSIPPLEFCLKASRLGNGDDHATTLIYINTLANAFYSSNQPKKAIPLYEEHLERHKKLNGDDYPALHLHLSNLANACLNADEAKKALPLYERSLEKRRKLSGDSQPDVAPTLFNLGLASAKEGLRPQAICYYEECLEYRRVSPGPDDPESLRTIRDLAIQFEVVGDLERSSELCEELLRRREATLGTAHADTVYALDMAADIFARTGRFAESVALRRQFLNSYRGVIVANSPTVAQGYWQFACHLNAEAKHAEVVALLTPYLEAVAKEKLLATSRLAGCHVELGLAKLALGQSKEASVLLELHFPTLAASAQAMYRGYQPSLLRAAEGMVRLYEATGESKKLEEAKKRVESWKGLYGGK